MSTWACPMNSRRDANPTPNSTGHRVIDPDAPHGERTYATFVHLSAIIGNVLTVGIPGLSLIAPLVMWQVRKKDSPFLDDHGREAVNFQITLLLISIASFGILYIPAAIFGLVVNIIAAVSASKGEFYRYPMCLRIIGG